MHPDSQFVEITGLSLAIHAVHPDITHGCRHPERYLLVGKQGLNDVAVKAPFQFLFIRNEEERGAESMDDHFFLADTHSADTVQR